MNDNEVTIGEIVHRRRQKGHDPVLELLLAKKWDCPHCGHVTTFFGTVMDVGTGAIFCPVCDKQGISPTETGSPELAVISGGAA